MYRKSSAGSNSSKSENNSTNIAVEYKVDFEQSLIHLQYLMLVQHVRSCGPACGLVHGQKFNDVLRHLVDKKARS